MIPRHLFIRKAVAVIAIISGGVLLHSCGKEKDVLPSPSYSIANKFVGSFVGWNNCNAPGDTVYFLINAGTDRSKATMPAFFGIGDCKLITTINAEVKGDSIIIPYTEYQDHCFGDYSIKGGGIYYHDSLFITVTTSTPLAIDTCSFFGRKLADTSNNVQQ